MSTTKVAIVTGSSNGIGKQLAIDLLKLNYAVVINGRSENKLQVALLELKNKSNQVEMFVGDLSDSTIAGKLVEFTVQKFKRIDVLINNAGVTLKSPLTDTEPHVFQKIFQTNVFGATNTTIAALPYIRQTKGSIVFHSSIAGIRGLPNFSAYCSSKMALRGIAESLRIEEQKNGIHVGLIYIGFTKNDDQKRTFTSNGQLTKIENSGGFKIHSQESVSQAVLTNIRKRKFVSTLTHLGKLNSVMQRFFPTLTEKIISRRS